MIIKDSIFDVLKVVSMKLQSRVEQLKEKHLRMEVSISTMNNLQDVIAFKKYSTFHPHKVFKPLWKQGNCYSRCLKINIDSSDIEDCQIPDNATAKNT